MVCRENFDLFTSWGRKNFFRTGIFGAKWSRHYVKVDTFGRYICWLIGHGKTWDSPDEPITVCLRCGKRIY